MPPLPKDPKLRQRRNRAAGAAVLVLDGAHPPIRPPKLPTRREDDGTLHPWHVLTRAWWRDIWASPMAPEYLKADLHGLYVLAELVNRFWEAPSVRLAAEIRAQQQGYGLTPLDRRRLQWEVQRVEAGQRRVPVRETMEAMDDPRSLLQVVS